MKVDDILKFIWNYKVYLFLGFLVLLLLVVMFCTIVSIKNYSRKYCKGHGHVRVVGPCVTYISDDEDKENE